MLRLYGPQSKYNCYFLSNPPCPELSGHPEEMKITAAVGVRWVETQHVASLRASDQVQLLFSTQASEIQDSYSGIFLHVWSKKRRDNVVLKQRFPYNAGDSTAIKRSEKAKIVEADRERKPVFHGWYIVGVAFLAAFIHSEAVSSTLSVFIKPMTESLGWSRGMISGVRSFEQILEAVVAPFIGPLVDRHGGRILMVVGALIAGVGFIAVAFTQELWQFYILRAVVTIGVLCFGGLVTHVAIANWFIRKRGRAFAISGLGGSLGTVIVIPVATWTILNLGWRETWAIFGVFVWVLVVAPAFLFMRRRPEDMGLLPDGDTLPPVAAQVAPTDTQEVSRERPETPVASSENVNWSRSEAIRTRAFWVIVVVFGMSRLAAMGINLHLIPYLLDLGYSSGVAASVFVVRSGVGLFGNPIWGLAAERYDVRVLTFVKFCMQVVAVIMIVLAQNILMVYGGFALYGIAQGGGGILTEMMFANYYGRLSLGAVRSLALPLQIVFSAGGPLLLGFSFDITGSYNFAFSIIIGASIVSAALILLATPPVKRAPVSVET